MSAFHLFSASFHLPHGSRLERNGKTLLSATRYQSEYNYGAEIGDFLYFELCLFLTHARGQLTSHLAVNGNNGCTASTPA